MGPTEAEIEKLVGEIYHDMLVQETGSSGFLGWFKMLLKTGISLSSGRSSRGGGINLGYVGTLLLLLIEAVLTGLMAYFGGIEQLKEPYCEKCFQWAELAWQSVTPMSSLEKVTEALTEMSPTAIPPAGLLAGLPAADETVEHGRVKLRMCSGCKTGFLSGIALTPRTDGKGLVATPVFENLVCSPSAILAMRRPAEAAGMAEVPDNDPAGSTAGSPHLHLPGRSPRPAVEPDRSPDAKG